VNGLWRVELYGARCRRVWRSSYLELITYCHTTFTIEKLLGNVEKNSEYKWKNFNLSHC